MAVTKGIPVVINRGVGDTEELVKSNRIGVVLKDFNPPHYKEKFTELLELMKEGVSLNKRCRKTAETYLALGMGVERYNRIYNKL